MTETRSEEDRRLDRLESTVNQHGMLLSRMDAALFGSDQRSGMIAEVAKISITLKAGIWVVSVIGSATLVTLIKIMIDGAMRG